MPDIIVLIFIVISANITYMYILLDQKEGKLFVETKALENSTNGALYLVISPLLVHVVNLSVSDCQLRLKSLTKLIIFLSWLYIKHMTDRIVLIFIFWLILDFLNLKIRKFNFSEIWSRVSEFENTGSYSCGIVDHSYYNFRPNRPFPVQTPP